MRLCRYCETEKPITEFRNGKGRKCLDCERATARAWKARNQERNLQLMADWRDRNREAISAYNKQTWQLVKTSPVLQERKRQYDRKYRSSHADQLAARNRSPEVRARVRRQQRQRYQTDQDYRSRCIAHSRRRLLRNTQARIANGLRNRLNAALRRVWAKKSTSAIKLLGCSIEHFMVHLESQFEPGMTWENRRKWHIDHIIPCAAFDLTDTEQQRACFHYTNLRPLWASENISKGTKILDDTEVPAIIRDVMGLN